MLQASRRDRVERLHLAGRDLAKTHGRRPKKVTGKHKPSIRVASRSAQPSRAFGVRLTWRGSHSFNDSQIPFGTVAQRSKRGLIGCAVMNGFRMLDTVEFDQHGALGQAEFVHLDR